MGLLIKKKYILRCHKKKYQPSILKEYLKYLKTAEVSISFYDHQSICLTKNNDASVYLIFFPFIVSDTSNSFRKLLFIFMWTAAETHPMKTA